MRLKALSVFALLVALAVACVPPAFAGGVVSTCDEPSLLAALTGGGTVTFTCSRTITVTGIITIASDTTIDGTGQSVTISGNNAVPVLSVSSGVTVSLNKLTIANGRGVFFRVHGGGITNSGTLTVTNSTFSGNTTLGEGGGILNLGATLTVTNSTFSGNSACCGGGIENDSGTLMVTNSTFSGNGAESGGGIETLFGPLTVTNSTFSGNGASGGGGINTYQATVTVTNSTFSGNSARAGGGILFGLFGTLTLRNNIVANNTATLYGGTCGNPRGTSATRPLLMVAGT